MKKKLLTLTQVLTAFINLFVQTGINESSKIEKKVSLFKLGH